MNIYLSLSQFVNSMKALKVHIYLSQSLVYSMKALKVHIYLSLSLCTLLMA